MATEPVPPFANTAMDGYAVRAADTFGALEERARSLRINDEANFNVLDAGFAAQQVAIFEQDKAQSRPINPTDLKRRFFLKKIYDHFWGLFSFLL